ncbi:MAG: Rieske 2Fe-2S domain-containing protein [Nitrospinaceae bacterium]|nr:ubiquinol-cytochrome c reductase iron-sulfur subunit [Nitrospinaceae bacterium]NIR57019.1 ubiquinol-cytochrome c reductase iron-sulfur subunit [Nitrospinaceae bacterium]NIS87472.1 ubiquinol-cytochrome c reductase iron-sulfur subunit [Nitrospinaceae bacterium]NIT84326.1 ubiquinol-cytochrome c reductase iron-sulfur subunit [Nitrospinaceae bacterium]NIU46515.1 ubiquinol-cytochrome c reductase iron-sulfur subunit [Nitrospinaceae bacterium]
MPPPPRLDPTKRVSIPLSQIPRGSSLLLKHKGSPVLAIHTEAGIKAFSAVCTHLGCLVKWIPEKKVFDCPCHAAQFDASGKVLTGPPPEPLHPVNFEIIDDNIIFL